MTYRRSAPKTAFFVLIAVVLALAAGEGISRIVLGGMTARDGKEAAVQPTGLFGGPDTWHVWDPVCGYRPKDATDPDSERPPYIPQPDKAPGEVRVVCMGDSTTYGMFLEAGESWPALLETYANKWAPDAVRFDVINGGVLGYDPVQCKRLLQTRYMQFEPDIVLWREDPLFADVIGVESAVPEPAARAGRFLYRSRLVFAMGLAYRWWDTRRPDLTNPWGPPAMTGAEVVDPALPAFAEWLRARGVAALIGVEYLDYRKDIPALLSNGERWRTCGIDCVALAPAFTERLDRREEFLVDNVHATPKGADLIARTVSDGLRLRWPELSKTIRSNANGSASDN